jgi:cell division transport system permease protein
MFKSLNKLDYLFKETILGLQRGGWMNWAAISTITVLLFLFGMSLQTSWQLEKVLNQFGNQLEVSVYLKSDVQAQTIEPLIAKIPEVVETRTITKEQAWSKLVQELKISDVESATEQLGENPLVDEIKVKARNSTVVLSLATQLAKLHEVDEVEYVDEAVKRISQLHRGLNWMSLSMIIILTLTAIAVTTTTIRLIVIARRQEIEIMQLVGATSTWIHLPFILQGMTFGLVGGAIAGSLVTLIQQFLTKLLANQPQFIQFLSSGIQLTPAQTLLLPVILLISGAAVGLLGSLFAIN